METYSRCLSDHILSEVPTAFFSSIIDTIFQVYRETHDKVFRDYDFPEASVLLPYIRRARIEENIRRIAQEFVELAADVEENSAQNAFHTVIYSATRGTTLTISATKGPRKMVRDARFRETLATTSQLELFSSSQTPVEGTSLYGIILHGADELDPSRPAYVRLGFPSRDCSEWVENFDLLKFCGEDYSRYVTPEEQVEEEVVPVLRPLRKTQQKQG
jgi:hypothetical protein